MKKNIPCIEGVLLTKLDPAKYSVLTGGVTFQNDRYMFHGMWEAKTVTLVLEFYGSSRKINGVLLDNIKVPETCPSLGLVLRGTGDNLRCFWDRLQIGRFPGNTKGASFVDEWVAGLCQLYAQATNMVLTWLQSGSQDPKVPSIPQFLSAQAWDEVLQGRKDLFYAWFPDAKPHHLGEWIDFMSRQSLSMEEVRRLNRLGPFAAGYYLVSIRGTMTDPIVRFCDSEYTVWKDLSGEKQIRSLLGEKKSKGIKPFKVLFSWTLALGSNTMENTSTFGWVLNPRRFIFFPMQAQFPLHPIRLKKDRVVQWLDGLPKVTKGTENLLQGISIDANDLMQDCFKAVKYLNPLLVKKYIY